MYEWTNGRTDDGGDQRHSPVAADTRGPGQQHQRSPEPVLSVRERRAGSAQGSRTGDQQPEGIRREPETEGDRRSDRCLGSGWALIYCQIKAGLATPPVFWSNGLPGNTAHRSQSMITKTITKDDRGTTITLASGELTVDVWYNRRERSWVAQYDGVWGGSDYVYTKAEAISQAEHYLNNGGAK